MNTEYDYIFAGGGCAALSLAYRMNLSALKDKRILILEKEQKKQNDKTWCFWDNKASLFESVEQHSWSNIEFKSDDHSRSEQLQDLRYIHVRSDAFYREVHHALSANPNIEICKATVKEITSENTFARVSTDQGNFTGKWVFNSIVQRPTRLSPQTIFLKQHFMGWTIQTREQCFNPEQITLMDFSMSQDDEVRFVYVLPFSANEALIEFTVFSSEQWKPEAYRKKLTAYIRQRYKLEAFEILEEEAGTIPMTNHRFPLSDGKRIIHLGTAAGLTKPTTGYTFKRIQQHSEAIISKLLEGKAPLAKIQPPARFRFYDNLLLFILRNQGGKGKRIFRYLFKRNRTEKILRFLDEDTRLWEEIPLLASLPWIPFLKAIWYFYIRKRTDLPGKPATLSSLEPKKEVRPINQTLAS